MPEPKAIELAPRWRSFQVERSAVDVEARTIELSFSSEYPVERWDGNEILDHSAGSVRLGRLQTGGPVLVDHNVTDVVAVVESVDIADRRGRAVVRFGKSARADEVFNDVVDGIRSNVSVGYRIFKAQVEERGQDGEIVSYRVTDWEPYEISIVSVPADPTVGVGRALDLLNPEANPESVVEPNPAPTSGVRSMNAVVTTENDPQAIEAARQQATQTALQRVTEVIEAGEAMAQFGGRELATEIIRTGGDVHAFNKALLERMGKKGATIAGSPEIGLTDKEARAFSFIRALHALANPTDRRAQEAAAFEFEVSRAAAEVRGKAAQGIMVPVDVLKRDLVVGTATAGGNTVSTDLLAGSFIEMLVNRSMMMGVATVLSDLNGNIAIPRQTGGATAYWVTEGNAPTESQQAFDQVTLSPKTVGAFTDISRKLLLQSSIDIEAFVRNDLTATLGREIDRAAINGSGSGAEPRGILNLSGIGSVAGGTNGAAPTWANIVALWSAVATANADVGRTGFLTNTKAAGKLMTTEKATNTAQFVCPSFPDDNGITSFGGARAMITNQVPSNLTKGTANAICSAIIYGNFADFIIGMWGGLDLTVDPFSNSTSGTVRVVALQDVDMAARHAASFAAMLDALTT